MDWDAAAPDTPAGPAGVGWTSEAAEAHAGKTPLQVAAAVRSEGVLELLLQNLANSKGGIDEVGQEPRGRSALHLAVEAGHAVCVEQLITRGANISKADASQRFADQATPMQLAALSGREDLLQMMLQYKLAQDEKLLKQIDVGDE